MNSIADRGGIVGRTGSAGRRISTIVAVLVGGLAVLGVSRANAQIKIVRQPEAREIARQRGWIVRQESPTGVIELQAIVNGVPKYFITHNAVAADSISTDEVLPGGSSGLGLTGSGLLLGVWDAAGVRTSHQEFGGRATQMDSPSGTHYHSTHVAGTMGASGVVAAAKGMSPAATLRCWDWNSDTAEMANAAAGGLRVSNHSYGFATGWTWNSSYEVWLWYGDVTVSTVEDNWFGLYTSYSAELDDLAIDYPYYLICKSAGNDRNDDGPGPGGGHYYINPGSGNWEWSTATRDPDGDYDSLGSQCVAKNILVVGAVEDVVGGYTGPAGVTMSSFSSWGPTDDGRIKPDICGNGVGLYSPINDSNSAYYSLSGTSMSGPNVAGSLGVLIQHWRATHPTEGDMRSATLKGLVIHTADEAGSANGPDYQFGWGLMNTLTAANTITADVAQPLTISEHTLGSSETFELSLTTDGSTPLRVTLSWTDPAGTPPGNLLNPTTKMLVNDLDLRLVRSSPATTFDPWVLNLSNPSAAATTGDNTRDNVEQVVVYSPGASSFTLQVTHKATLSGGGQAFSLIITGASTIGETECDDDEDCSDGLWCNGIETCVGGECQAGTPPDCSDAFSCTIDWCNEATDQCQHDLVEGTCLIGGACYDSGDANPANDCQACIPASSGNNWTNRPAGWACGDPSDSACDNPDTCNGAGACLANLEPAGTECRPAAGVCDVAEYCTGSDPECPADGFQPAGTPCPDGLFCNGEEACDASGVCQPGENPCPGQACRESDDTCVDCLYDSDCDDGVFCNGAETCDAGGSCQSGSDPCPGQLCRESDDTCVDCLADTDCEDANECTHDTCTDGVCVNVPLVDGTPCDDGDVCQIGETCQAGECVGGAAPDCSGFDEQCREASCDPSGTEGNCDILTPVNEGQPCDDGDVCWIGETCQAGECVGGAAPDCSGFDEQCREASCDPSGTEGNCDLLAPVNEGLPCDDLQFCTVDDVCLDGVCTGVENDCDDGVECTVDSCDEEADTCLNTPDHEFCANGAFCDGVEICDPVLGCLPGEYPCDAGEWCDEVGDSCVPHGDGDFDGDLDVDLKDFAAFQSCFGQAGTGWCSPGNMVGLDAMIDLEDLVAFVTVLEGSGP